MMLHKQPVSVEALVFVRYPVHSHPPLCFGPGSEEFLHWKAGWDEYYCRVELELLHQMNNQSHRLGSASPISC